MKRKSTPAVLLAFSLVLGACSGGADDRSSRSSTTTTQTASKAPKAATPRPLFASELLVGDAKPNLPAGDSGKIAVIAQAPLDRTPDGETASLSFAFRNNTDESVGQVSWAATARVDGELLATGSDQGSAPAVIAPGEVGFAYIYFKAGARIPDTGAEYEFTPSAGPAHGWGVAPLVIDEFHRDGDQIIGSAMNKTDSDINGPIGVSIYCFDGDQLTGDISSGFAEERSVAPGGAAHFTVKLHDPCKTFAMSLSGF